MNEEIKELKLELEVLRKRVSHLEAIERRRNIIKIIKVVIIIVIVGIIVYYGYKFYSQIMNDYNQIKNFIDNPLKSFM